ncbi:unnamed protein product [Durusdinium trenchii]|uniref:Uncharacterized protein n=2 Tax=Durusdinium trenchii TaxID=1381693 RepID=A0ABP0SM92_9DINO
MSKSGQSVLENVEGYDTTYIDTHLDQPVDMAVLTPQRFGSPSSRPREYRLTWNKKHSWQHDLKFSQLASEMLVQKGQTLPLTPTCFAVSGADELKRIWGTETPGEQDLPE